MAAILLVEADPDTARRNAETLERADFRVEISPSGVPGAGPPPDVIVLSVARLEQSELADARAVAPLLIISSDPADAPPAAEFGCAEVLIRPVMYDELVGGVRRILTGTPPAGGGAASPPVAQRRNGEKRPATS